MKMTPEQRKAFKFHRKDANERVLHGCVPTHCSCTLIGVPCEDALKGFLQMTISPEERERRDRENP